MKAGGRDEGVYARFLRLACVSLLAATIGLLHGVDADAEPTFREGFHWQNCPYYPISGSNIRCGRLGLIDPAMASLPIVVIQHDRDWPRESAVLYLEGGPGAATGLDPETFFWPLWFDYVGFEQDLVVFDQRGTGRAVPSLHCPEIAAATIPIVRAGMLSEKAAALGAEAKRACHDRLVQEGHDLTQFTTTQLVADAIAVMEALPYGSWTIVASSYGTRVALEIMHRRPGAIRSVVLDGAVPPDIDISLTRPELFDNTISMISLDCPWWRPDHPPCRDHAPAFFESLDLILADFARDPHVVDRGSYEIEVGSADLMAALVRVAELPDGPLMAHQGIVEAVAGYPQLLTGVLRGAFPAGNADPLLHLPVFFSIACDRSGQWSEEDFALRAAETTHYRVYVPDHLFLHPCTHWTRSKTDESLREPVVSDIPTLVISGEFDPQTPVEWGERVSETLPNGFHLLVPGGGHGAIFEDDDCVTRILRAFLADPLVEPDRTCVLEMMPPSSHPQ